ncbi:MAG: UbiH/UbiF family hydroxylase [Rhodocyclaceae bacterium]|nr:UbiH/UbiF family hydroxylase [Rhodocyclaceae bacterium]
MDFDVVIVGGGLAGLSLAVALRSSRLRLALIEAQEPVRRHWDARIYAISPSNVRFLQRIGIWDRLEASLLEQVTRMRVRGDRGGELVFSAWESGVEALAWIVEASLLQDELWQCAKRQANLTAFVPAQPMRLEIGDRAAVLELADGRLLRARLVVAADGADSWTRRALGLEVAFRPYEQRGVVANFVTERPHLGTAYQWFRDDGVLAYLPLPGERISIVWSCPEARAKALLRLSAEEFCAQVAAAGEHAVGRLTLLTPPQAFPLRLMRAPRVVGHRWALIGDAAHTIHPLSGHGINLGFKDAESLASVLEACPVVADCGEEPWLRRHERARREEVVLLQGVTDGLAKLFGVSLLPLAFLRNVGLSGIDRLPAIKNLLARYAMG